MQKMSTRWLVKTALIAALYVAVTLALAPISYGEVQFRLSEVLVLLAFFQPAAIPGLVIGCFLANLGSPLGPIDPVLGTLATLLSVLAIRMTRRMLGDSTKSLFIAGLWPVVFNGVIVGAMLTYLFGLPFFLAATSVAFGEAVVVLGAGVPLFHFLKKREDLRARLLDEA